MQPGQNITNSFSGAAVWIGHPDPGHLIGRTGVGAKTNTSIKGGD